MIDLSKARDMLREFSNFKIHIGGSAIRIYDDTTDKQLDVALIYKSDGLCQVDMNRLPKPNKDKFMAVLREIQERVREQEDEE